MAITALTHGGQGRGFGLSLKPSIISTVGSIEPQDITDLGANWKRAVRLQGGYWTGVFSMPLTKRAFNAFDVWLGCHVEERSSGAISWEGMVYEMELAYRGMVYRRSLETMWNWVNVSYVDMLGVGQLTGGAQNTLAIDRYGQKEIELSAGVQLDNVALAIRDRYLAEYSWPYSRPVAVTSMDTDSLTVTCCGYGFPMNWHFSADVPEPGHNTPGVGNYASCPDHGQDALIVDPDVAGWTAFSTPAPGMAQYSVWTTYTLGAGGTCWGYLGDVVWESDLSNYIHVYQDQGLTIPGWNGVPPGVGPGAPSEWYVRSTATQYVIDALASGALPWLTRGYIETNWMHVQRVGDITYLWDAMQDTVTADEAGNLWRLWVGPNQALNYTQVTTEPKWLYSGGRWLDLSQRPVDPWALTPGVVRNMDWRYAPVRPGYWLTDPRDFLVEEFTVAADGTVSPTLAQVNQTEMLIHQLNQLWSGIRNSPRPERERQNYPANWNVEAGTWNEPGPGGDYYGYWVADPSQPSGYKWVEAHSLPGQRFPEP